MEGWSDKLGILLSFITASLIVYISIPSIVAVSNLKGLFDKPGHRRSHTRNIPNLGGVAIFAGLTISLGIFTSRTASHEIMLLMAAMTILFFVGIKDDILVIAPNKKLSGEIFAILIMVVAGNIRFTNLYGFLGIHHIPYFASVLLTSFVMIVIINAFNLIDGIDGLASGIGIILAATFGTWFFLTGYYHYAILAAAIAGSYVSFFGFNVFGDKNKVFMGDTGSLILGLLIALLVIKFNEINAVYHGPYRVHAAPAVSFGFLIIPMFDTMRVFLLRILRGRSPFSPDKNHLHHRVLLLGFSHIESTLIIVSVNILFIFMTIAFQRLGILTLMVLNISMATALMFFTEMYIRKTTGKDKEVSSAKSESYKHASAKSA